MRQLLTKSARNVSKSHQPNGAIASELHHLTQFVLQVSTWFAAHETFTPVQAISDQSPTRANFTPPNSVPTIQRNGYS